MIVLKDKKDIKFDYLKSGQVSKRLGCIKDNAIDIHYQEDLEKAKERI